MSNDIPNINWLDLYAKLEGENHEEVSFSMLCGPIHEQNQEYTNGITSHDEPPQSGLDDSNPIEGGGGASSSPQPPMEQSMIETGCLINPFGVPYRPQMVSSIMPTFSLEDSSLVPENVRLDGKKRMLFEVGENERRRKEKKIKNRESAAKFKLQKLERTKCLEEEVEKLRSENAILKGEIMLQKSRLAKQAQEGIPCIAYFEYETIEEKRGVLQLAAMKRNMV